MLGAGLLAKKAVERGLSVKPWVKTSLAPGSKVVTDYLKRAGLTQYLERLRFQSGRLWLHDLYRQQRPAAGGDRGRGQAGRPRRRGGAERQPQLRRTHQSAGALQLSGLAAAGGRLRDRGHDGYRSGPRSRWATIGRQSGYLRDIWPTTARVAEAIAQLGRLRDVPQRVWPRCSTATNTGGAQGPDGRSVPLGEGFDLRQGAAVLRRPGAQTPPPLRDIKDARVLAMLGDSVTTDHISPAGSIPARQPGRQVSDRPRRAAAAISTPTARAAAITK